jgi:hypothetical protein
MESHVMILFRAASSVEIYRGVPSGSGLSRCAHCIMQAAAIDKQFRRKLPPAEARRE